MKKLLQAAGVLVRVLWTWLGLAARLMAEDQVHVVVSADGPGAEAGPTALLAERAGARVRLSDALGTVVLRREVP